jgi:hypothetical protein
MTSDQKQHGKCHGSQAEPKPGGWLDALGSEAFDAAGAAGRGMALAQSVEYALEEGGDP